MLNDCYQRKLQQLELSNGAVELFKIILKECNTNTQKTKYLQNRNMLIIKLNEVNSILSQARKLFVVNTLKFDDYNELKKESQVNSKCLKKRVSGYQC